MHKSTPYVVCNGAKNEANPMAIIAHDTRPIANEFSPIKAVLSFFGDIGRAGHAAARYQHLASMNDRQLADHGCTREDAGRAAYEESFGKL